MGRKVTHEEFVDRVSKVNPNITIIGKYVNMHTKIECICNAGHHWFPIAQGLVDGDDCFQCAAIKRGAKRAKNHEQFVEEVRNVNPDITVIGTYKNANTKIEFRCKEGHKWVTTPNNVLAGKTCLICANIQSSLRQRKSHEQFVKEVHNLHPDIVVLGTYINSKTKIEFMCTKGHKWETAPYNILDGCSCPKCKGEKISQQKFKTHEQFLCDLQLVNPDITILSKYQSAREKVDCMCNKCNHKWQATPNNLLRGFGCPKCNQSKGEKMVEDFLIDNKIVYETQKRFSDCVDKRPLPFDFYLPDYNLCIEYQGEQHYKATRRMGDEEKLAYRQKHDAIKREYCKVKEIHLLEIPYTKFNHISEILSGVVNVDKNNLNERIGGDSEWQNLIA